MFANGFQKAVLRAASVIAGSPLSGYPTYCQDITVWSPANTFASARSSPVLISRHGQAFTGE